MEYTDHNMETLPRNFQTDIAISFVKSINYINWFWHIPDPCTELLDTALSDLLPGLMVLYDIHNDLVLLYVMMISLHDLASDNLTLVTAISLDTWSTAYTKWLVWYRRIIRYHLYHLYMISISNIYG